MIKVCLIVLLATFAFANDCESLRKSFKENEKALFNSDDRELRPQLVKKLKDLIPQI